MTLLYHQEESLLLQGVITRRIKQARKKAGLSQVAMSSKLGVARQTYLDLENGKTDPKAVILHRIARVTGCEPAWLFGLKKTQCPCRQNPRMFAALRAYEKYKEKE